MCYAVHISTNSPENLVDRNSELVRFEKVTDADSDTCIPLLDFPNKWHVGSKSVCSCTFRHLDSSAFDLGFSEPEDWYEEDQDDILATRKLYGTLSDILSSGYLVDIIDRWEGTQVQDIKTIDVSLDEVSERRFRLFEGFKFRLKKAK